MIAIITDSTCDIPEDLLEKYRIIVIPNTVNWGSEQYRDRLDLTPPEFFRRLAQEPLRPTTSTPALPDFQKAYAAAAAQGADSALAITISSAMSGVYQMALNSAREAPIPVTVMDARGPTMSLGWQVLAAARARESGASLSGMADVVTRVRNNLTQLVCMDTLEYLKKGGRIGNAAKWVGVMLNVKPVVTINHQTGLVEPFGLARTHKSGVDMMYARFLSVCEKKKNLHVAVLHGNALPQAEELAARLRADLDPCELLINFTGPVLAINTGPGALALCGYAEDWL